jgi:hypothetical protein
MISWEIIQRITQGRFGRTMAVCPLCSAGRHSPQKRASKVLAINLIEPEFCVFFCNHCNAQGYSHPETRARIVERLVARPLPTANATVAAIFRIIELARPTLLIDEADTFLKENDELRGILNTGHRRGGQVLRTVGEDHEPRQFSTWAPAAIAMIGRLPDTLNDRSVVINLRRRKPTEKVKSFRRDRAGDLDVLARKMARWAHDHTLP